MGLLREGLPVEGGKDNSFMNPGDQRDGDDRIHRGVDEEPKSLEGMTEDEGCLGVVGGCLVKFFDGRHLPSLFGDFYPIKEKDQMV